MIRIKHGLDGAITITANGQPIRLPPKGQELVFTESTKYQWRNEYSHEEGANQNGSDPEPAHH